MIEYTCVAFVNCLQNAIISLILDMIYLYAAQRYSARGLLCAAGRPKAQTPVQTPAGTIRFYDEDAELLNWLKQFADRHDMTNVIKLACYVLSGLQPDQGLLALLPESTDTNQAPPSQARILCTWPHHPKNTPTTPLPPSCKNFPLSVWSLPSSETEPPSSPQRSRRSSKRPARPPTLPEEPWLSELPEREPVSIVSSGLDMSGPYRRRVRPPDQACRGPYMLKKLNLMPMTRPGGCWPPSMLMAKKYEKDANMPRRKSGIP